MAEKLSYEIQIGGNQDQALGSLKKQLKEATAEVQLLADKFGATSKEAIGAAKRAAELKDKIGDAKDLVAAFNPDAKFKSLTASLSGVAGGFAAVQGGIALFGVESKEVEKSLLKVQSAMALSQGLQSVGESIDSFKNLGANIKNSTAFLKLNELANKAASFSMKLFGISVETTSVSFKVLKGAIAATGIGLLVVALGEVVSMFQNFTSEAEKAAEKQKEFNKQVAEGAKTQLKGEQESLSNQEKIDIAKAKSRGASEKEIFDLEQSYRRQKANAQVRFYEDTKNADAGAAAAAKAEVDKINAEGQAAQFEFDAKQLAARREQGKKLSAEKKQQAEQELKEQIAAEKEAQKRIAEVRETIFLTTFADENAKKIAELNIAYNKERDQVLANTLIGETTKNDLIKNLRTKLNIDLDAIKKDERNKQAANDAQMLDDAAVRIEKENALEFDNLLANDKKKKQPEKDAATKALSALDKKLADNQTDLQIEKDLLDQKDQLLIDSRLKNTITEEEYNKGVEENSKARIEIDKQEAAAKIENAQKISSLLSGLSDLAGKETAAGKAFAIASATIDTYLGATKAYQSLAGIPVVGPALGAVAAGVAVAGGIKNVKSILAVKVPGGGGGGGGGNISAPSLSGAPIAPPELQPQTTTLDNKSINAIGAQAPKAYVVESELTGMQKRIARLNEMARFG
jgi:hypothetical protein